jgi:hypothetical protein
MSLKRSLQSNSDSGLGFLQKAKDAIKNITGGSNLQGDGDSILDKAKQTIADTRTKVSEKVDENIGTDGILSNDVIANARSTRVIEAPSGQIPVGGRRNTRTPMQGNRPAGGRYEVETD